MLSMTQRSNIYKVEISQPYRIYGSELIFYDDLIINTRYAHFLG